MTRRKETEQERLVRLAKLAVSRGANLVPENDGELSINQMIILQAALIAEDWLSRWHAGIRR